MSEHPGRLWFEAELAKRSRRIRGLRLNENVNVEGGERLKADNYGGMRRHEQAHYERLVGMYFRGRFRDEDTG